MKHDVIVVGGSHSGMAAALQLLRARRRVLVIDTGLTPIARIAGSADVILRDGRQLSFWWHLYSAAQRTLNGYRRVVEVRSRRDAAGRPDQDGRYKGELRSRRVCLWRCGARVSLCLAGGCGRSLGRRSGVSFARLNMTVRNSARALSDDSTPRLPTGDDEYRGAYRDDRQTNVSGDCRDPQAGDGVDSGLCPILRESGHHIHSELRHTFLIGMQAAGAPLKSSLTSVARRPRYQF
jgi:hypothetical protein